MTSSVRNRARRYHEAIREAFLTEWDPIGIAGVPEAQDEYDGYVPTVYKMLISRQPRHELFNYLWWLETEHMGLAGDRQATERFTDRLMRISDEVENFPTDD
jgi:hypothetical protein